MWKPLNSSTAASVARTERHVGEARPNAEAGFEVVETLRCAVGVNLDAAIVEIPSPSGYADLVGRMLREITIADALNAAGNQKTACLDGAHVFLD